MTGQMKIFGNHGTKSLRTTAIALRQPGWLVPGTGTGLMGAGLAKEGVP